MAVTPNSVRSTRTVPLAVNDRWSTVTWPIGRLTGLAEPGCLRDLWFCMHVPIACRCGRRLAGQPVGSCPYEGVASDGGMQLSYGPAGPLVLPAGAAGAR